MEETHNLELYSEEQIEKIEKHIAKYFGDYANVLHEIVSPDIHVDICVIEPTKENDYYTLVTMGMGAHNMNVPEQFESYNVGRAELLIKLPSNWDLHSDDEKWYWPIRLLKTLARYPIEYDTWLGCMHSVSNQEPFADNTELNGVMLVMTEGIEEDGHICKFDETSAVNFYQVIPLYDEEMNYKIKYGADKFLDKLPMSASVVDIERKNVCKKPGLFGKLFG